MKTRRFSFRERQEIERLLFEGMTFRNIANYLNRAKSGVWQEVKKNGGIKNYNAFDAQKNRIAQPYRATQLEERIGVLEEHLKLIYQQLDKIEENYVNNNTKPAVVNNDLQLI